jgi:hypothetical protein
LNTLLSPPWPAQRAPLKPVVAVHVDETLHRWRRRQLAERSRHVQFAQRMREDDMLAAHLHGLALAGATALAVAQERCQRGTPAEHFVLMWARLAAHGGHVRHLLDALNALADDPAALDAACDTLRWALPEWQAPALAVQYLGLDDGPVSDALLRLCGQQRLHVDPAVLQACLEHPRPAARQAAYEYCASLGLHTQLPLLVEHLDAAAAAAAAFRLGERELSVPRLMQVAAAPPGGASQAIEPASHDTLVQLCAGLHLSDSRAAWQQAQAARVGASTLLAAAEASNDPAHLPWLLQQLADPTQRDSTEAALGWLTGWLTGFEPDSVLGEQANDTYSATDVQRWLSQQPLPQSTQQRWLAGAPLNHGGVFDTLLHGPLRYRHHAARHLAWAAPQQPLVCLQAPAADQLSWLYEAESALQGEPRDAETADA